MFEFLKNLIYVKSDFPVSKQISFQTPASESMELIIDLHHYVMFYLFWILGFVVIVWLLSLNTTLLSQFVYFISKLFYSVKKSGDSKVFYSFFERFSYSCRLYSVTRLFLLPKFMDLIIAQYANCWYFVYFLTRNSAFFSIYNSIFMQLIFVRNLFDTYFAVTNVTLPIIFDYFEKDIHFFDRIFLFTKEQINVAFFFVFDKKVIHSQNLEIIWTIIPSLILLLIAGPSLWAIYSLEEPVSHVFIVVKVIGHQWYWSYEIVDFAHFSEAAVKSVFGSSKAAGFPALSFDSYIIPSSLLKPGQLRLLDVDNVLYLPARTPIQFIITADDVLHSWAVPSLGVKVDAVPGRLNSVWCFISRIGEFYGQCSELCGIQHGFMPIKVISYVL